LEAVNDSFQLEKAQLETRISIDEVADSPHRANQLSPEKAREMMVRIAVAMAALSARIVEPSSHSRRDAQHDRLLDVNEAAARLGISPRTLYEKSRDYAFTVKNGGSLRFSEAGIDKWIARRSAA
jgi:predicted DNA-binding transcriptional regulator AlpA